MRILVTGPTGTAGSAAVRQALKDPRVTRVTAISRRPLSIVDPKLEVLLLEDFNDWSPIADKLKGQDAVLWCLGISQSKVSREQLHVITHDFTLAGANAIQAASPKVTFCFLSGGGADPTERSRIPFAREKGMTENALGRLGLRHLFDFRPAYIHPSAPLPKRPWPERLLASLAPLMHRLAPALLVDSDDLARAMIEVSANGYDKAVLNNRQIRALACK